MRNIRIEASACIWWAVLLMILPLRWLIAAFLAGSFHELCHYLAIRAAGGEVEEIVIRNGGAAMVTTPLTPGRELLCSLAGPVFSTILVLFAGYIPLTALCALVQSAFNLLPMYPMDGGRALKSAAQILLPHIDPERICRFSGFLCVILLCVFLSVAIWRYSVGLGVLLPIMILAQRFFPGKRPCKTANLALQ